MNAWFCLAGQVKERSDASQTRRVGLYNTFVDGNKPQSLGFRVFLGAAALWAACRHPKAPLPLRMPFKKAARDQIDDTSKAPAPSSGPHKARVIKDAQANSASRISGA
jgi:hypothetical protein